MEMSLSKMGKDMAEATRMHAIENNIIQMNRIRLDEDSSIVEIEGEDGKSRKFAVVVLGVVDKETNIFYWADSVQDFSEYTREACTKVRDTLDKAMILEATNFSLNISDESIAEARDLDNDGGRYVIDEDDSLLSRFSAEELMAVIFSNTQLKGIYAMESEHEAYHFGIISALS